MRTKTQPFNRAEVSSTTIAEVTFSKKPDQDGDQLMLSRINVCWSGMGLLLLGIAGCVASASGPAEDLVPVSGTAVFDGKPYERLMVTFMPTGSENRARQGTGVTDADGNFVVMNYQNKEGLPAGTYTVVFSLWLTPDGQVPPSDEPPANSRAVQAIPSGWNDIAKAGPHSKVVIEDEGNTDLVFKIPKTSTGGSTAPNKPPANFMR